MDLKIEFKEEFEKTCSIIKAKYIHKEEQERNIAGETIIRFLHEVQFDCEKLSFIDFYKKYLSGSLYLDCTDFTKKQIEEVIDNSPLCERDRKLAILYWVDMATEETIADKLGIDRKTVRSNTPKISMILKETASKMYK